MPPAGVTLPPLTYAHLLLIGTATRVVRYVNYASFTFMVWDMLLTLPDEVKYIWKARWTVIKVVFLSNRYVTPIILIGNLYTISGQAKDLSDQYSSLLSLLLYPVSRFSSPVTVTVTVNRQ
ncbi:hypothetical protein FRB91_006241 [Serendipita sp. 411]|nr:hypothetical protein FRB91_006241 [Serendipita sp. 411]